MKSTIILTTLSALLTPTLSSPIGTAWSISSYTNSCSPGGCTYSFSIACGSSPTIEPDFSTTCTGTNVAGPGVYQACTDGNITSNSIPGTLNETILVSHMFYDGGVRYNVTGNTTLGTPLPETLAVYRSEIEAVA